MASGSLWAGILHGRGAQSEVKAPEHLCSVQHEQRGFETVAQAVMDLNVRVESIATARNRDTSPRARH